MKNGVMMQYFEWFLPDNGSFWKQLKEDAMHLKETGITAVWIPPACKSTGTNDPGYGVYDLYDLGEFDQKGSVRTKYGTKQELQEAIEELHKNEISVYFDTVINHKAGADYTEKFMTREVDPYARTGSISDGYEIEGWTGFDFPGRGDQYSAFKWHWFHFSGIDFNNANGKSAIYQILGEGKSWSEGVNLEYGNYDYLMFADIDYSHPDVAEEIKNWGIWVANELNLDGIRIDAVKHINRYFLKDFLETLRSVRGENFYAVGEYQQQGCDVLEEYLSATQYEWDLFDTSLQYNLQQASKQGVDYDLRQLLDNTIVKSHPELAVTFVDNHDFQAGSAMQHVQVQDWFKALAYGLILLMKDGYPCIFYGDYYGTGETESHHRQIIDMLLEVRRTYAYGDQNDYFDHACTVGFVRTGYEEHPNSGLALLISNGENGEKTMYVGKHRKGEIWREFTGNIQEEVTIDEQGNGNFSVEGGNLAVWVKK